MTTTDTEIMPAVAEPRFQARTPVALPRPQAPAVVPQGDHMSSMMEMARMLAGAKQAIPSAYQQNPGAVVLALGFAESRGLDILTVVGSVAFVGGKPIIDATLQRALAKRAGYTVRITRADDEAATVEVHEAGQKLGEATYTIGHAQAAGLTSKDNWRKNTEDMLVARATTRAIRRFAPDVMTGVLAQDEADEFDPTTVAAQPSPVAEIAATGAEAPGTPTPVEPAPVAAPEPEVIDAEVVDQPTPDVPVGPWADSEQLKAALKDAGVTQVTAIQTAQQIDQRIGNLAGIVGHPEASAAVQALIEGGA